MNEQQRRRNKRSKTLPGDACDASSTSCSADPSSSTIELRKACQTCSTRKKKCTGVSPCALCISLGLRCVFVQPARRGPKPKKLRAVAATAEPPAACEGFSPATGDQDTAAAAAPSPAWQPPPPPAAAGQLLGLEERKHLQHFLMVYHGMGLMPEVVVRRTAMRLMTGGDAGGGGAGGGGDGGGPAPAAAAARGDDRLAAAVANANECLLWVALACGAALHHPRDVMQVQQYIMCACTSLSLCGPRPILEVLRVHVALAWLYITLEDFAGFFTHHQRATRVAQAMLDAKPTAAADRDAFSDSFEIDHDGWLGLEGLKVVRGYVLPLMEAEPAIKTHVQRRLYSCFDRLCCDDYINIGQRAVGQFFDECAPAVPGLPSFGQPRDGSSHRAARDGVEVKGEQGGPPHLTQAMQLIAASLQELALPATTPARAQELLDACTRNRTRFAESLAALDRRGQQVLRLVNAARGDTDMAAARRAGIRVRFIVERFASALGNSFILRPSFMTLLLVYNLILLRLVCGDEVGGAAAAASLSLSAEDACLALLLRMKRMLCHTPGLLHTPSRRHNVHWLGALLLSAGLIADYSDLARTYNELSLASGLDTLPEAPTAEDKTRMCLCSHPRCAAVQRLLADQLSRGTARVFVHNRLQDADRAAGTLPTVPSEIYITLQCSPPLPPAVPVLDLQPSGAAQGMAAGSSGSGSGGSAGTTAFGARSDARSTASDASALRSGPHLGHAPFATADAASALAATRSVGQAPRAASAGGARMQMTATAPLATADAAALASPALRYFKDMLLDDDAMVAPARPIGHAHLMAPPAMPPPPPPYRPSAASHAMTPPPPAHVQPQLALGPLHPPAIDTFLQQRDSQALPVFGTTTGELNGHSFDIPAAAAAAADGGPFYPGSSGHERAAAQHWQHTTLRCAPPRDRLVEVPAVARGHPAQFDEVAATGGAVPWFAAQRAQASARARRHGSGGGSGGAAAPRGFDGDSIAVDDALLAQLADELTEEALLQHMLDAGCDT
ncbi:hypothetical protein JKP88DRAFT_252447 [Tribonema minus]|uniref:Zn(2)-C6 fungal-type domain-containing protein n=1 Tax=Tribonema minus TaxID=303371 RepID=A0A835ZDD0_9STRA|nr:hypothetical protein JKP88DRAFT_252447 [Tribonema minus]